MCGLLRVSKSRRAKGWCHVPAMRAVCVATVADPAAAAARECSAARSLLFPSGCWRACATATGSQRRPPAVAPAAAVRMRTARAAARARRARPATATATSRRTAALGFAEARAIGGSGCAAPSHHQAERCGATREESLSCRCGNVGGEDCQRGGGWRQTDQRRTISGCNSNMVHGPGSDHP